MQGHYFQIRGEPPCLARTLLKFGLETNFTPTLRKRPAIAKLEDMEAESTYQQAQRLTQPAVVRGCKRLHAFTNSSVTATALVAATSSLLIIAAFASGSATAGNNNPPTKPPRHVYDPADYLAPLPAMPRRAVPSPGNSEAGSPVRGYIYAPPRDNGSITNRLVPPSMIRR